MPAEELGMKFFTRERIRNRMLKRAAEVWGYSESEIDEFDPLVVLLMEACAVEFERTAAEIGKTQNRMLERLAQLMYPEISMVHPAYGIMQAVSSEPETIISQEAQFTGKGGNSDRNREEPAPLLYFSPARNTRLINGKLSFMASCREIFSIEEGVQKIQTANSNKRIALHQHTLWLGLQLDEAIESLNHLSFFFNWMNDSDAETWYQYLPFTQWTIQGSDISIDQGLWREPLSSNPETDLKNEFDNMSRMEGEVEKIFERQFLHIKDSPEIKEITKTAYPAVWEQWFDKKDLQELKEPLIWLQINFPTTVPTEAIDSVLCSINCFPVINRKLNKITYKMQQKLNILPLEAEGSFVAVKEIVNTEGRSISMVPFGNPYELQPESYTLRYGINRFNERNSYETLVNLLDLMREESSFFSSLGEDFLAQHIRELNQILARIESRIRMKNKHEAPYPFLAINHGSEGGIVTVEFWSCMGEAANKIPMGTKLSVYQKAVVESEGIYLMTTTFGGRDSLSEADKLVHYKKSLFTRNRIVTPEDMRCVILAELGNEVKAVDIKRTFMKSSLPGQGFIRCMQVILTVAPGDQERSTWEQKLLRLKVILESQSSNHIPIQIICKAGR